MVSVIIIDFKQKTVAFYFENPQRWELCHENKKNTQWHPSQEAAKD